MRKMKGAVSAAATLALAFGLCPAAFAAPTDDAAGLQAAEVSAQEEAEASAVALEKDMLYQADSTWNKEDGSEGSSMGRHLNPAVELRLVEGGYDVRITPVESSDAMIADLTYDGKSLEVVSAEGVTPRQFKMVVESIDDPIVMGVVVNAGPMGQMSHTVQLVVDKDSAKKVDPAMEAGANYTVPVGFYKQGTYGTDSEEASMAGGFFEPNAEVAFDGKDAYTAKLTLKQTDQVTFEALTFGDDDAAKATENEDGSTTYEISLGTLSEAVKVGFTYTPAALGRSMTHYADLVFKTASVEAAPDEEAPAGDAVALEKDKLYTADMKVLKADSDDESMAKAYIEPTVDIALNDEGKYEVTVYINDGGAEQNTQVLYSDGTAAVKSSEDPLAYTLAVDSIADPVSIQFAADAMKALGAESQPARLSIDASTVAEKSNKMYRLYNPNSGEHFYTANAKERAKVIEAGWTDEGEGWTAPGKSTAPVYRLYNSYAGEHHYTLSADERDGLVQAGWTDEGIGWYSAGEDGTPLYREYNPNEFSCNHNYTADKAEHEGLVALGWTDEGIAWYGVA